MGQSQVLRTGRVMGRGTHLGADSWTTLSGTEGTTSSPPPLAPLDPNSADWKTLIV